MNGVNKKNTFGDYFVYRSKVYRTFTNYHPDGFLRGHLMYSVKGKKLSAIPDNRYLLVTVSKDKISDYFPSVRTEKTYNKHLDNIYERLENIGIDSMGATGSNLLRYYGLKKDSSNSDTDIVVMGMNNSKKLFSRLHELYDDNFKSYIGNEKELYNRRVKKSGLNTDMYTISNFEAKKPVGTIDDHHINITPTYYINKPQMMNLLAEPVEDLGYIEAEIEIVGIQHAGTIPGYYNVRGVYKGKQIRILRSTIFFFLYPDISILGKKFKVSGKLIGEISTSGSIYYVLELTSRWDIRKYSMVLL